MTFAWSFSALSRYRNCPRQYYHLTVAKDFNEIESEANKWGQRVHQAMANRIGKARPLPEGMTQWEKWADYALDGVDRLKNILQVEQKLAVTADMKPCLFFDKSVEPWLRTVLDVLKVDGEAAHIIDWKTGRNIDVDSNQLAISAAVVFCHHADVQRVKCEYVWLAQNISKDETIERKELRKQWAHIAPQVARLMRSLQDRHWPAQPSGLCIKHCPVTTCEYYGRGNR